MTQKKKKIQINLVDDKEIRRLNREWFGEKGSTDVIAFNYGVGDPHGEVYVSVKTAKRQARERGVDLEDELLRLAIHGILHVKGYNDTNLKDFCKMRQKEWEVLIKAL